tara:strand:- start:1429 stop:1815 length:387 start_codon:yes stop_codon:yes gene_type:complete
MKALIAALILAPSIALAHSQVPGFKTEYSFEPDFYKTYTLTNEYDFPAVFRVDVFTKDMKPALGWKAKESTYKLLPKTSKAVRLKFKVEGRRKLLVCTTLTEIGKDNEKASIISRVCSRLIINDNSKR